MGHLFDECGAAVLNQRFHRRHGRRRHDMVVLTKHHQHRHG